MGAQPSGAPGWPLFAFSTASTASRRNVSMDNWSMDSVARLVVITKRLVLSNTMLRRKNHAGWLNALWTEIGDTRRQRLPL